MLTPDAFLRLPLEGLALVALAVALPPAARRLLAWIVGPGLALVLVLKVLDIGFLTTFDRQFDLVSGHGLRRDRHRDAARLARADEADLVVGGMVVLVVALFVLMTLAARRLTRVAAAHRRSSLWAVTTLGAVWVLCWTFGAQFVPSVPVASTSAAGLAVHEVRAVWAGIRDPAVFAEQIDRDRFRDTPATSC